MRSIDDEEHEENVVCIACPVRDNEGKAIASISVSWPTFRFEREILSEYADKIKDTALKLSRVLGYID